MSSFLCLMFLMIQGGEIWLDDVQVKVTKK